MTPFWFNGFEYADQPVLMFGSGVWWKFFVSSDFWMYSSLSMTTMDTPLSTVSMTTSLSLFSSCMAFASSFVMFGLGSCVFLKICLISPLSSYTFPCFSCWHTLSIWEIYLLTGGSLVAIAKLGPWARAFSCTSVRWVFERLCTHFTLLLLLTDVIAVSVVFVVVVCVVPGS